MLGFFFFFLWIGSPPFRTYSRHLVASTEYRSVRWVKANHVLLYLFRSPHFFALAILYSGEYRDNRSLLSRAKENSGSGHDVSRQKGITRTHRTVLSHPRHRPLPLLSPDVHLRSSPLRPLNFLGTLGPCNFISVWIGYGGGSTHLPTKVTVFLSLPHLG
jgi:hypothetical protein